MTASPPSSRNGSPWLGPLAEAMAEALPRLYGAAPDPLLRELIVALTAALERGELELPLQGPPPDGVSFAHWPAAHRAALERSGLAAALDEAGDPPSPLVVTAAGGIAWRRWHEELQRLLTALQERALAPLAEPIPAVDQRKAVAEACRRGALDRQQQRAVEALLRHRLVLLGGGPGTGKTSTVVQMLATALGLSPQLRVGLSAPTGKAAARLKLAIEDRCRALPEVLGAALLALPCGTLHRLLESQGDGFARNRQNPLAIDLLVVDEVSMLDLSLATALIEALPEQSQLLLVGDPAQLPPVAPGAILAELHQPECWSRLGEAAVELSTPYRNQGAIAAVANLLRQGDQPGVLARLQQLSPGDNLAWLCCPTPRLPAELVERMRAKQQELRALALAFTSDEPSSGQALLRHLEAFIVLSPLRRGPWGVEELNRRLLGPLSSRDPAGWPPGTPVICTRNQNDEGLSNGDLGVIVQAAERAVLFPGSRGEPAGASSLKLVHPARLEGAEAAYALTIHKAQGSEYQEVWLLFPKTEHPDIRSLYTGLTRAREQAVLVTPPEPGWLLERDPVLG
ncbi:MULTISPECIES: ATP-dependent RecD-like DNA helicase [unclassified Synechococcus]|uniref:ATP-dependent DNA helicase n=1 Tax=unclassified Synechococcus TaxID=2626047 RepID=UPI0020CEB24D|nr:MULTISPECIES: AAA family ATPase [unclassified Synechococcus]